MNRTNSYTNSQCSGYLLETYTVYGFNLECLKFRFIFLLEGICATLNLHIQALKKTKKTKQDIYLKDIFWRYRGERENSEN